MFNVLNRINTIAGVVMLGYYTITTMTGIYKSYKFEKSLKNNKEN